MSQHILECRQWQLSGLPCGHAIAVAKATNRRDVYSLVDVPYFKTENYKATYIGVINPAGPPETWQSPDIPLPTVLPPIVKKRRAGRPNLNARRPSRGEGSSLRRCPRCGDHGHKSDTCPLFPASASGSSQRSTLEPHGTIRTDITIRIHSLKVRNQDELITELLINHGELSIYEIHSALFRSNIFPRRPYQRIFLVDDLLDLPFLRI
ncbi:hypothetical protein OSB04_011653 [Centaurea solstitialis]|uniref:CCHC-type domain-containing protein n=1 Tax=Centaurea solstitialis TaxID=347529 RepID=A0AA38T9U9_9ASTR|nr:hypothetical protein OSB04_011653 [Centaurea solstitialis]